MYQSQDLDVALEESMVQSGRLFWVPEDVWAFTETWEINPTIRFYTHLQIDLIVSAEYEDVGVASAYRFKAVEVHCFRQEADGLFCC